MLRAFCLLLALALTSVLSGCASNYYNVPRDTFEKKTRVLGIAPIFVDVESDIRHPDREALVNLVREYNRASQKELVARIRETGAFFSVVRLEEDADQLFQRLYSRRERRDDGGIVYNKHFFKEGDLKELLRKNSLDAVMLVVVSGITKEDTVISKSLPPAYLDTSYNFLIMTAQILGADGIPLWEYPNFRKSPLSMRGLLALQYPAFDEAKANLSDSVAVRFKTIPGITRALMQKEKDILLREQNTSALYGAIFDDMAGLIKPPPQWFGNAAKPAPATP